MSNRGQLVHIVVVATLTLRLAHGIGEDNLTIILLVGLLISIVWTFVDYKRGKRVFIWQKSSKVAAE